MNDIVAFLHARLDERARVAEDLAAQLADPDEIDGGWSLWGEFGVLVDRAVRSYRQHELPGIEATRRIIAAHHRSGQTCPRCSLGAEDGRVVFERDPCETLRLLALPYAGHPAYQREWAP